MTKDKAHAAGWDEALDAVREYIDELRAGKRHPDGLLHDSVHEDMSGARPAKAVRSTSDRELRDCGQDGVCAISPGCQRHRA